MFVFLVWAELLRLPYLARNKGKVFIFKAHSHFYRSVADSTSAGFCSAMARGQGGSFPLDMVTIKAFTYITGFKWY